MIEPSSNFDDANKWNVLRINGFIQHYMQEIKSYIYATLISI